MDLAFGNSTTAELLSEIRRTAQLPADKARALPPAAYVSPALLELEIANIFHREWICLGREDQIPHHGDYFSYDIVGQPVFVVRRKDGSIGAYSNSCLHRGSELLQGSGNCRGISCPYHAWSYDLEGRLDAAPFMDRVAGFDVRDHRLPEIRLESWHGFLYGTLNEDLAPVAERLAGLESVALRYRIGEYRHVLDETEVWNTNWKCLIENFLEPYHLFRVHPKTFNPGSPTGSQIYLPGAEAYTHHLSPDAEELVARGPVIDRDLERGAMHNTVIACVFPAHLIQLGPDHLWYLSLQPDGTDRVRIRWRLALPAESLESPDAEKTIESFRELLTAVNLEDRATVEGVRRGVDSVLARGGPLSPFDWNLSDFWRYLANNLTNSE